MKDPSEWERRLAAEGLAPLDAGTMVTSRGTQRRHSRGASESRELFLSWAKGVLRTAPFKSEHQRRVWELYAAGKSVSEIQSALAALPRVSRSARRVQVTGVSRRSVSLALDRVRRMLAVPSPVRNPWWKGGNGKTHLSGPALEALVRKVVGKLRRMSASEQELLQHIEVHTMGNEKATTTRYDRIVLKQTLVIPGIATAKDMLLNVDGRAHAGGIDVVLVTEKGGEKRKKRFTIPWHAIKQAEVDAGEADAA